MQNRYVNMGKNGTGTIVVYTAKSDHEYFEVIWHDGSILPGAWTRPISR